MCSEKPVFIILLACIWIVGTTPGCLFSKGDSDAEITVTLNEDNGSEGDSAETTADEDDSDSEDDLVVSLAALDLGITCVTDGCAAIGAGSCDFYWTVYNTGCEGVINDEGTALFSNASSISCADGVCSGSASSENWVAVNGDLTDGLLIDDFSYSLIGFIDVDGSGSTFAPLQDVLFCQDLELEADTTLLVLSGDNEIDTGGGGEDEGGGEEGGGGEDEGGGGGPTMAAVCETTGVGGCPAGSAPVSGLDGSTSFDLALFHTDTANMFFMYPHIEGMTNAQFASSLLHSDPQFTVDFVSSDPANFSTASNAGAILEAAGATESYTVNNAALADAIGGAITVSTGTLGLCYGSGQFTLTYFEATYDGRTYDSMQLGASVINNILVLFVDFGD